MNRLAPDLAAIYAPWSSTVLLRTAARYQLEQDRDGITPLQRAFWADRLACIAALLTARIAPARPWARCVAASRLTHSQTKDTHGKI